MDVVAVVVRDYSLPGSYRRVVVKPSDVSWRLLNYDDVTVPLVSSDLEVLNGVHLRVPPAGQFVITLLPQKGRKKNHLIDSTGSLYNVGIVLGGGGLLVNRISQG